MCFQILPIINIKKIYQLYATYLEIDFQHMFVTNLNNKFNWWNKSQIIHKYTYNNNILLVTNSGQFIQIDLYNKITNNISLPIEDKVLPLFA